MEYMYLGSYAKSTERIKDAGFHANECVSTFVSTPTSVLHFIEYPEGIRYSLNAGVLHFLNHSITLRPGHVYIYVNDRYVFVGYANRLDVMSHRGRTIKRFASSNIIRRGGLFLVNEKAAYIVDGSAGTVFTKQQRNVLDFTEDGNVLCVAGSGAALAIVSFKGQKIFDTEDRPIFEMEDISVFEGSAIIRNVVCASHARVKCIADGSADSACDGPSNAYFALCPDAVFLVLKNFVARKALGTSYEKIIARRFVVHNFLKEESFYELLIALAQFTGIALFYGDKIEQFLCRLILHKRGVDKLIYRLNALDRDALSANIGLAESASASAACRSAAFIFQDMPGNPFDRITGGMPGPQSPRYPLSRVLCRAYRRVDDRGKCVLEPFIDAAALGADDLYYIIIYKPHLLDYFIKRCIGEHRLFYLQELVSFYAKVGREEEMREALLENGLLIAGYRGLEKMLAMERMEVEAQKMEHYFQPESEYKDF